MTSIDSFPQISHSDLDMQIGKSVRDSRLRSAYTKRAIANVFNYAASPRDAVEIGQRIYVTARDEEARRQAHHVRYRNMILLPHDEYIADGETDDLVESMLIDFDRRAADANAHEGSTPWQDVSKGVSGELAYIEQLGDWAGSHELDAQVRRLKCSTALAEHGLEMVHIHNRDDAKISYSLRLAYNDDRLNSPLSLLAIRKRAVADVGGSQGNHIEIVRRSGFMINPLELSKDALAIVQRVSILPSKDDKERKALAQEFGEEVVEPFVRDRELRQGATTVFPVTSLYFALDRHPESDN